MISLVKRDLMLARPWEYLIFIFAISVFLFMDFAPDTVLIVVLLVLVVTFFFYDHYYKLNRYFHSLPIKPSMIILSRYISSFLILIATLGFQYIFIKVITLFQPNIYYQYTLEDIFILVCLATVIISLVIPIYQLFKSFFLASIVTFSFMMLAIMSFTMLSIITEIEKSVDEDIIFTVNSSQLSFLDTVKLYITTEHFTLIGSSTLGLFIISVLLSIFIYKRRNLS